jgi:hypothetical protein
MNKKGFASLLGAFMALSTSVIHAQCMIRNAHDAPPASQPAAKTFALSKQYPATLPPTENYPWLAIDFRSDWQAYMRAVLDYAREGNETKDWYVERNTVRKWYHAPWMDRSDSGREYVHGLTRERTPAGRDLRATPALNGLQTWAVGAYNDRGGFSLGQVWEKGCDPDASKARFDEGTMSFKLLFTTATPQQLPFLANTLTWDAHIWSPSAPNPTASRHHQRSVQKVRLFQLDIAVRDDRALDTGWVFGTFVYSSDAPGSSVFDRMVPISLQWGNDPSVLNPTQLKENRINTTLQTRHFGWPQRNVLGWRGRANGPLDNKESACMSCHGTAQFPRSNAWGNLYSPARGVLTDAKRLSVYFRNIKNGELFDPDTTGAASLDYSLQLQSGMERLCASYGARNNANNPDSAGMSGLPQPQICQTHSNAIQGLSPAAKSRAMALTVKGSTSKK